MADNRAPPYAVRAVVPRRVFHNRNPTLPCSLAAPRGNRAFRAQILIGHKRQQ